MNEAANFDICVIGGGPAGLAAAEAAVDAGARVLLAEQKPSVGRKFLMAGKSGLNITRDEPPELFDTGIAPKGHMLSGMTPAQVTAWAEGLGQAVFTGSSGRVFPRTMKASPLLRAWIARLRAKGVVFRTGWRWSGWTSGRLAFETAAGPEEIAVGATVLALGGGSWARLGSDGAWAETLAPLVEIRPFAASNMGFVVAWSDHMARHFGAPVKPARLSIGGHSARGEFVVSARGIEGSAVYALSAALRAAMTEVGATVLIDLAPDLAEAALAARLARGRGKESLANRLRKAGIEGVKAALLREGGAPPAVPGALAARIKATPLHLASPRPLDEAISTVGGVALAALDDDLMLRARPGMFCAGEMIDWDAPTGGYLITTCLATGRRAGTAAARFASDRTAFLPDM